MKKPVIAEKAPKNVTLEPGTYFWCSCGKSKNQPFCDGSHRGSEFVPMQFEVEEKKEVWLCQCKNSSNKPYCDGAHRNL